MHNIVAEYVLQWHLIFYNRLLTLTGSEDGDDVSRMGLWSGQI